MLQGADLTRRSGATILQGADLTQRGGGGAATTTAATAAATTAKIDPFGIISGWPGLSLMVYYVLRDYPPVLVTFY